MSFFKQAILENKNKIQALENITQASLYKLTEEFYKVAEVKSNSKQAEHFDKLIADLDNMTEKIELIDNLRDKTKILYKRYNHLVDTTKNLAPDEPFTEQRRDNRRTTTR